MAGTNYSDLGVVYNHPSIISTITNNDTIFTSATGNRPFFCVISSERGKDNKIQLMSTVKEYLFEYGEPNLKKYGQMPYNIINILQNGETVYVLRVLPDNAGYSHAMLNLQTKIAGTKSVKDVNDKIVQMDNVIIRPTVTYSKANNSSKSLLEYELTNNDKTTVDGYRNNPLFYVVPKGRGKYYDTFGFRIYLNKSYDDTYDFRVYNFEVIQFDEYNNPSIIEGPFYVSLDPDAMTSSNQSMFIEDVVNRYSQYLEVKFNEDSYDYITNLINPDVAPSHIDILSGITREINNKKETFFDSVTMMDQDVHIRVFKYDDNGNVLTDGLNPITNYVDSSDSVEQSIISIDNNIRNDQYAREVTSLENMKQGISSLYTGQYKNNIESVGKLKESTSPAEFDDKSKVKASYDKLKEAHSDFTNKQTAFENDKTELKFTEAYTSSTNVGGYIETLLGHISYLRDYSELVKNDSALLSVTETLDNINNILDTNEIISIKLISYKSKINSNISEVVKIKTLQSLEDEVAELKIILSEISTILDYFKTTLGNEADSNQEYTNCIKAYNKAVELIGEILSDFTPDNMKEEYMVDTYEEVDKLLSTSLVLCNSLILKNEVDTYNKLLVDDDNTGFINSIMKSLAAVVDASLKEYEKNKDNETLKAEMINKAKEVASSQQDAVIASKNNIYTTQLQDFSQPIQFRYGSEGDLDESNQTLKNKTFDNLCIKGYKGLIDDGITSKKIIPARFIIDANYSIDVKNAMHVLVTEIRDDIFFYCDLGFTASAEDALTQRDTRVNFSSNLIAIYAQDFTVYDEYTGKDIKVTTPYFLASKIPYCSRQFGLQYPIAGNKRGIIDGFKQLSWNPNETYKELLYNKKINYVESDTTRTRFGSQLTSEMRNTPLSNINNVITVIDIKNDVEVLSENYQFEFNNQETIDSFQSELDSYLTKYVSSKAVERISCSVYASDYDKLQKIIRVSITIKFYDIIERILINLDVVKQ